MSGICVSATRFALVTVVLSVRCHGILRARKKEVNNGVNAWLGGFKVAASLNMCLGKYVCECARDRGERCEESREGIKYKSVKCI